MWKLTGCIIIPLTSVYCKSVSCEGKNDGFVPVDIFEHERIPEVKQDSIEAYLQITRSSDWKSK